jgi:hypothetical protein
MRSAFNRRAGIVGVLLGAVIVGTGCFHTIITTDLPPSTEVYREPFKSAFIAGLVPAQVDASRYCEGRRWARVETQQSFLNWVVAAVTIGIFTPLDIRITCAAAGAMHTPDGPTLKVGSQAGDTERNEALAFAMRLAKESGAAIYVAY